MTDLKTNKAGSKPGGAVQAGPRAQPAPLPDPKARFRAVMRQAAAARAAGDKARDAAKTEETESGTASTRPARRKRSQAARKPLEAKGGVRRAPASTKSRVPYSVSKGVPKKTEQPAEMAVAPRPGAAFVEGIRESYALWGEFAKSNLDRGVEAAYALVTAKSMHEMIEIQKGWTASSIGAVFTQGLRLSDVALDTTRKAVDRNAEGAEGAVGEDKNRVSA